MNWLYDKAPPEEIRTCEQCAIYKSMWNVCPISKMPHQPTDKACRRAVPKGCGIPWNEEPCPV